VGSSTPAQIAAQLGDQTPIPHISAGVEAYATGLPPYAAALNVNSLSDLSVALSPLVTLDPSIKSAAEAYQDSGPGCAGTQMDRDGLVTELLGNQQRSRAYLKAQLNRIFDVNRQDPQMVALRQLYGTDAVGNDPTAPEVLALVAGQAIKGAVSQCVSFRAAQSLDTHTNWAADQAPNQERGWRGVAALINDLMNTPSTEDPTKSVLDFTTVLAFSEFSRTPLFNTIRGRDHFLGSSCLVAGAGIKGGLTVGGSAAVGMMPVYTDLGTGQGSETPPQTQIDSGQVQFLRPEHVIATVLASAGLDGSYLRASPIQALLAT
jgi:uncharacterized protein DUF1501